MYCNNHVLCLGDCPKSLTYNHMEINNFEFLKYFLSSDVRYAQIVINEIRHNIDTYDFFEER